MPVQLYSDSDGEGESTPSPLEKKRRGKQPHAAPAATAGGDSDEENATQPAKRRSTAIKKSVSTEDAVSPAKVDSLFDNDDDDDAPLAKPVRRPPRLKKGGPTAQQAAPAPAPAPVVQAPVETPQQQDDVSPVDAPPAPVQHEELAPAAPVPPVSSGNDMSTANLTNDSQEQNNKQPETEQPAVVEQAAPLQPPPRQELQPLPPQEERPSAQFGLVPAPEVTEEQNQPEEAAQTETSAPATPQQNQQQQQQSADASQAHDEVQNTNVNQNEPQQFQQQPQQFNQQQQQPRQQQPQQQFGQQQNQQPQFQQFGQQQQQQPNHSVPSMQQQQQQQPGGGVPSMASQQHQYQDPVAPNNQNNSGASGGMQPNTQPPLGPPALNMPVQYPPPGVNPMPPHLQPQQAPPGSTAPPGLEHQQQQQSSAPTGQMNYMMASPSPSLPQPVPINNPALLPLPGQPEAPLMYPVRDEEGNPGVPPLPAPLDIRGDYKVEDHAKGDKPAWDAFCEVQKKLVEAHGRTTELHERLGTLQLNHEREAADVQVKAAFQIESLRKELQTTTDHYNECQAKLDTLTGLLHRKAEQILKLDADHNEAKKDCAAANQAKVQLQDKLKISESARQVAEVRQKELEMSIDHTTTLVNSLRAQLYGANDDKIAALQVQYAKLEENRQQLIAYYTQREAQLLMNYNGSLKGVQKQTDDHIKTREKEIAGEWQKTIASLTAQYKALEAEVLATSSRHQQDQSDWQAKSDFEREKWITHLKDEMVALETRHAVREDQVLVDIARRERELAEREQQTRVQMAREAQEAKMSLLAREAELKAYYESIVDALHKAHATDREKLMGDYRDQVGSLSRMHESNERELERLHRDKEREMAQRYRIAGYEVDDKRKEAEMSHVTNKTTSSLLTKMESVERTQRERAEVSRMSLRGEGATTLSEAGGATTATGTGSTHGSVIPKSSISLTDFMSAGNASATSTGSGPIGTSGPLDTAAGSASTAYQSPLLAKMADMEKAELAGKKE